MTRLQPPYLLLTLTLTLSHHPHMSTPLTTTGKSALLLGATGAVGKALLTLLLANPAWTRVGEYGRRVTPPTTWSGAPPPKLEQKVIDFEDVEGMRAGMRTGRWDVVFVTLGTTKASAGGAAQFEKIDRECVRACVVCADTDVDGDGVGLGWLGTSCVRARRPSRTIRSLHNDSSTSRCVSSSLHTPPVFNATILGPQCKPNRVRTLPKASPSCLACSHSASHACTRDTPDPKASPNSPSHVSATQTPSSFAPPYSAVPIAPNRVSPSGPLGTSLV